MGEVSTSKTSGTEASANGPSSGDISVHGGEEGNIPNGAAPPEVPNAFGDEPSGAPTAGVDGDPTNQLGREQRIRDAAYRRFQGRAGDADPVQDWLGAEAEIDAMDLAHKTAAQLGR